MVAQVALAAAVITSLLARRSAWLAQLAAAVLLAEQRVHPVASVAVAVALVLLVLLVLQA